MGLGLGVGVGVGVGSQPPCSWRIVLVLALCSSAASLGAHLVRVRVRGAHLVRVRGVHLVG